MAFVAVMFVVHQPMKLDVDGGAGFDFWTVRCKAGVLDQQRSSGAGKATFSVDVGVYVLATRSQLTFSTSGPNVQVLTRIDKDPWPLPPPPKPKGAGFELITDADWGVEYPRIVAITNGGQTGRLVHTVAFVPDVMPGPADEEP